MIHSYRIKDIRVTTYDGAVLLMQLDGIFQGPRLKIENMILDALRPRVKNDIPVKADFHMVEI